MTTAMSTATSTGLAFLAVTWSAAVSVAPVDPNPCAVCDRVGAVTVARVTWDGKPNTSEFAMRECCRACTPAVVDDTHEKHDPRSRRQIRVELDPSAR